MVIHKPLAWFCPHWTRWLIILIGFWSAVPLPSQPGGIKGIEEYQREYDSNPETEYDLLNARAELLIKEERFHGAYKLLAEAIQMDEDDPRAYVNFGVAHAQQAEFGPAILALDEALACDSEMPEIWYLYSKICFKQGRMEEAMIAAKEVVSQTTRDQLEHWIWLANVAYINENHNETVFAYDKIAAIKIAELEEIDQYILTLEIADIRYEAKTVMRYNPKTASVEMMTVEEPVIDEIPRGVSDDVQAERLLLQAEISNAIFRKAAALIKMGKQEDGLALMPYGFQDQLRGANRGLYSYALLDFERAAKNLKSVVKKKETKGFIHLVYLLSLIADGQLEEARQGFGRLKELIEYSAEDAWIIYVFEYINKSYPKLAPEDLLKPSRLSAQESAKVSFYQAQIDLSRGQLERAIGWLTFSSGATLPFSFENKASILQLLVLGGSI